MTEEKLILLSNDDGMSAKGFDTLIRIALQFGKVIAVAPATTQSGKSHSVTLGEPVRYEVISKEERLEKYIVYGSPVDCVKTALTKLMDSKPDIMISGINHGSNSAISVIYSGTMGAAIEASFVGIPAVGLSLTSHDPDADFDVVEKTAPKLIKMVIEKGLPEQVSLNVNYPICNIEEFKGYQICSQTKSYWREDFEEVIDKDGNKAYIQKGNLVNMEPENKNCDEYALANNYAAIVPIKIDFTEYNFIKELKTWKL